LRLKASYFDPSEKAINRFLWDSIYKALKEKLKPFGLEISNAVSVLGKALEEAHVQYEAGSFTGSFNSRISKELKKLGAKFSRSTASWKLPASKVPIEILLSAQTGQTRLVKLQQDLIQVLDTQLSEMPQNLEQQNFNFESTITQADSDIRKALSVVGVEIKLTAAQKKVIKEQWEQNLKLFIKDWSDQEIIKLRGRIKNRVLSGERAKSLEKIISKSFGTSKSKARFLARQETSLLVSKLRETRYEQAGLPKYIWSTSGDVRVRPFHKRLNNTTQLWSNPPIVDEQGNRKHPGEDFNCRCVPIPVIE